MLKTTVVSQVLVANEVLAANKVVGIGGGKGSLNRKLENCLSPKNLRR